MSIDWSNWILQKNNEAKEESLKKSDSVQVETLEKNKVNYSIKHVETHPPGRDDEGSHGGATFHIHKLTNTSPKRDPSNHIGTVETDGDGHVSDSDFHQSVPSEIKDGVHSHIQENHDKLISGKPTKRQKV